MSENPAPSVVAIGGVFLFSQQPEALADWYRERLGLVLEHAPAQGAWFARFPYRELDGASERTMLFTILTAKHRLRREGRQFTLNLRVADLRGLLKRLREAGVETTAIEEHAEGRFAWTHDPDGNRLELWEDTVL